MGYPAYKIAGPGTAGEHLRSVPAIRPENLSYLEGLPASGNMTLDEERLFMTHTSRLNHTAYDVVYGYSGRQ